MLLSISKLSKSYGPHRVLREVDFSMDKGERVALTGPSGSGKSTLLNCVAGIDRPDGGEILLNGRSIGKMDENALCALRRESISTVYQFFHLLPTLTARENIEFPLKLLKMSAKDREERVSDLVRDVQIEHRASAFPDEMSGGECQRVAIARALVIRPQLILADEPTGNLDSRTGETILDLLESLSDQHGIALLLVTHSEAAARICHRRVEMRDGTIAEALRK